MSNNSLNAVMRASAQFAIGLLFLISLATVQSASAQQKIFGTPESAELQVVNEHVKEQQTLLKSAAPVDPGQASNGCGPEWLLNKEQLPNFELLLNTRTFIGTGNKTFTVNFKPACDLHDTGYAGLHVIDKFGDGVNGSVDYSTWSRARVDKKFYRDLCKICDDTIPSNDEALPKCKGVLGADVYRVAVEKIGYWSFDCNLNFAGLQRMQPCTRATYLFWNTGSKMILTAGELP